MAVERIQGVMIEAVGERSVEGLMVGAIGGVVGCVSVMVEVRGLEAVSSVCGEWWARGSCLVYEVLRCSGV